MVETVVVGDITLVKQVQDYTKDPTCEGCYFDNANGCTAVEELYEDGSSPCELYDGNGPYLHNVVQSWIWVPA